jgi:hypothetical protein
MTIGTENVRQDTMYITAIVPARSATLKTARNEPRKARPEADAADDQQGDIARGDRRHGKAGADDQARASGEYRGPRLGLAADDDGDAAGEIEREQHGAAHRSKPASRTPSRAVPAQGRTRARCPRSTRRAVGWRRRSRRLRGARWWRGGRALVAVEVEPDQRCAVPDQGQRPLAASSRWCAGRS